MPKRRGQPLPLQRASTHGLAPALVRELDSVGGLWWASDYYTTAGEVVDQARGVGARGLRLDFHDLSFLADLPDLEYLWIRSDGFPGLTPVGNLRALRCLLIETGGMRGELDPIAFPELRWLATSLGGKLGPGFLDALRRGHPHLRSLDVHETRIRRITDLGGPFPELRRLRVAFADHVRDVGPLVAMCPRLETLRLHLLVRIAAVDGLAGLETLRMLDLSGGQVTEVPVLRDLPTLRYVQLLQPRLESIEPLRGHPGIRMLSLGLAGEPDPTVLASIPGLVAIGRGRGFERDVPWPDLMRLPKDDPLRVEWSEAL
jgi:uncharacterized protein (DUF3820 family)